MADSGTATVKRAMSRSRSAATKKFMNDSNHMVRESLEGFVKMNPGVRRLGGGRNLIREDVSSLKDKVAIVAGVAAGHEPFPAGFIAKGFLTGAAIGRIFTAPAPPHTLPFFQHLHTLGFSGILLVCLNYTGARLNFGMSKERARQMDINIRLFILGDDCANSGAKAEGRRGLAGVLLLLKIACAMAEEGASLNDILREMEDVEDRLGSLGVCLYPGSRPGRPPLFNLGPNDMELGIGIHGETGVARLHMRPAGEIVQEMLNHMTDEDNKTGIRLHPGSSVVLLVNNLGGTSKLEEYTICREAIKQLEKRKMSVVRVYTGQLMTSLDTSGMQLTILQLPTHEETRKKWLLWLDFPTEAPSWPKILKSKTSDNRFTPIRAPLPSASLNELQSIAARREIKDKAILSAEGAHLFEDVLHAVKKSLAKNEMPLNDLDYTIGDADCGSTILGIINGIVHGVEDHTIDLKFPQVAISKMADLSANTAGGTTGSLYNLLFTGLDNAFSDFEKNVLSKSGAASLNRETLIGVWIDGFDQGINLVMMYGGAKAGDRTMLDAMLPALEILKTWQTDTHDDLPVLLKNAKDAAEDGARSTAHMTARVGRASYVAKVQMIGPDPGATAASVWIRATVNTILEFLVQEQQQRPRAVA